MIQPEYEISVWKDEISNTAQTDSIISINKRGSTWNKGDNTTKTIKYLAEKKIAVIGKDNATNPLYAYNITFKQNINGTSTLTFNMLSKYLPNGETELIDNPLASLLRNETKLKLKFQEEWYDLIVQQVEESKVDKVIKCVATDLYVEELAKSGYNISYNVDSNNSVGNIYDLANRAVENSGWEVVSFEQKSNKDKPLHSDIIRQYVREPFYKVRVSTTFPIQNYKNYIFYYDKDVSVPLPLLDKDITNTNYIYVPYSQYNNPNYRFQFLLSNKEENRQSGNYEVDEEGYLTDVKQCYIDLNTDVKGIIEQNEIEKNYPLFLISIVSDKNALTYSLLQSSSCERLVLPQQTQRDKILGSIVKLYKYTVPVSQLSEMKNFGIYKDEKGKITGNNTTYYGVEEVQCNSFNSVQNLLGFSSNWTDASDIKDGWEPTTWTDLRVYGPRRVAVESGGELSESDVENSGSYSSFGTGAPWERVNLMWIRPTIPSLSKMSFYSNSVYNEENVPNGIFKGEEYTFRVCYGLYVNGLEVRFSSGADKDGTKSAFNHRTIFNPLELHLTKQNGRLTQASISEGKITHFQQNNTPLPFNFIIRLYTLDESGNVDDYLLSSLIENRKGCRGNLNEGEYSSDLINTKQKQYQELESSGNTNFCWVTQQLYAICKRPYSHQELKQLARERRLRLSIEVVFNKSNATELNADCKENGNVCYVDGVFGYDSSGLISVRAFKKLAGVLISSIQFFKTYRDSSKDKQVILPDYCQDNLTIQPETWYKYYTDFEGSNSDNTAINSIPWLYKNNIEYNPSIMQPIYERNALRVKNFEISNSNRFNILQKLAETFECWVKFTIMHDEDGHISLDNDGNPQKYITFHNEIGKEHQLGFSYKRNLTGITRTLDSKQIATKLIVPLNSNSYGKDGYCAIGRSVLCPTGENYFYNFDYYCLTGALDKKNLFNDLYSSSSNYIGYYNTLAGNNHLMQFYNNEITAINLLLIKLQAINTKAKQLFLEGFTQAEKMIKTYKNKINSLYSHIMNSNSKIFHFSSGDIKTVGGSAIINSKHQISLYDNNNLNKYGILTAAGMLDNETINEIKNFTKSGTTYTKLGNSTYDQIVSRYREYCNVLNIIQSSLQWQGWSAGTLKMQFRITENWAPLFARLDGDLREIFSDYFYPIRYNAYTSQGEGYTYKETDFTMTKDKAMDVFTQLVQYMNIFIENYTTYSILTKQIEKLQGMIDELNNRNGLLKAQKQEVEFLFNKKYGSYIREGVWSSEEYADDDLYYLNAVNVLNNSAKPKLTYNMSVIDLSSLEGYDYYTFRVGDRTYIEDEEFFGYTMDKDAKIPNREKVILNEVTYNLSDPSKNSYTIQNYKSQFDTFFQQLTAQVQSAQFSKGGYDRAAKAITGGGIRNKVLDNSLNNNTITISNLLNNSVKMGDTGLVATNPKNPCQRIEINNNGFNCSVDGGKSWFSVYDILAKSRINED